MAAADRGNMPAASRPAALWPTSWSNPPRSRCARPGWRAAPHRRAVERVLAGVARHYRQCARTGHASRPLRRWRAHRRGLRGAGHDGAWQPAHRAGGTGHPAACSASA
ncbi:hypothetical protein AU476_19830 [Cupriavidus sp. UYMSc13B]|nr:hypothetical protein AU476_19830 [Cupriavidus sp. UYMSc13B]